MNQNPGIGTQFTVSDARINSKYYLYLPYGYDINKSYPLVVTIHGFVPFDTADRQIREWQSTADKYGLIVVAPVLGTSNQVMLWLNEVGAGVKRDEQVVMGVLDHVLSHTAADPDRVLITGWSTGGFLMHYLANQHPDRFAAICSRGSCFNPRVLNEDNARLMGQRRFPVMIFYGQDDGLNIKLDSDYAIKWYKERGFAVESFVIPQTPRIPGVPLGHNRQPELAATFFLRVTGLIGKLHILSSSECGPAPLPVNLSVQLPHHVDADGLTYLWTLDGEYLADSAEVYTSISKPGIHDVQVVVTDRDGRTFTASRQITVLPPGS
ncbi:MAG: prolyl oligopeptidase family serine peptidase [Actinobacteria bacterium]|nr:prolyl oligopeptidase family serine peptidase [Actinomycetota bacterium]